MCVCFTSLLSLRQSDKVSCMCLIPFVNLVLSHSRSFVDNKGCTCPFAALMRTNKPETVSVSVSKCACFVRLSLYVYCLFVRFLPYICAVEGK